MAKTGKIVIASHDWPERHWDMYVDLDESAERLATWALDSLPGKRAAEGLAAKLADHRRVYLTYEGEVSDGRGRVAIVFEGEFETEDAAAGKELKLKMKMKSRKGEKLTGELKLAAIEIPIDKKTGRPVIATRNNWKWNWQPE
ncbi:MAG: DNA polymerase ligase N-terminal domain-containing protein [bacterium]